MVIISRNKKAQNKKAKVNNEKFQRWTDEDDIKPKNKKEEKDPSLCNVDGCENLHMFSSNVCPDCYLRISNEMSKTVKKEDCIPLDVSGDTAYKKFARLLESEDDE